MDGTPLLDICDTDIAIIGMAGHFPGARNIPQFWHNLRHGVESIHPVSDEDLIARGVDTVLLHDPNYVKVSATLPDMEMFDAAFFGFSPKEAAIMDPQHRHFLECAWEALEDAGHPPAHFAGSIGVFAGCGMNAYFIYNLLSNPHLVRSVGLFLLRHTGNDKDFLTTRVSYCLNLTGPSMAVQTACSSSLVAIHLASQHLLSGECDMALAGGVTIVLPHGQGYVYQEGEILAPDGHCRAFDAASKGTVFGSGAGVVVLRRLRDALEDGDDVRAIIKGSAINNDGAAKVGYLAPSVDGQARAVLEALTVANVPADTVTYVETHGTGTPIGDPIEIAALTQAFREQTQQRNFCAIGSLKTNIGHLDTAAGVASVIKTVLALQHKQLPPSLHFNTPNPAIDFASTPFFVNRGLHDWTSPDVPRRAGVNSLGVGGTNAHVILQEAPQVLPTASGKSHQLVVLSARSAAALANASTRLAEHLQHHPEVNCADVAYTLQVGRTAFDHRRAVLCRTVAEAITALTSQASQGIMTQVRSETPPTVVFMFPGGGAQYPNMGRELYDQEPAYRQAVDRCLDLILQHGHRDLRPLLYPQEPAAEAAAQALAQASHSVLSIFVTEYALAQLWMSWGVTPAAMIGHSLGEYTAACLAGVMSLEDALTLVAVRGELFDRAPAGAMLSVPLSEAEIRPLLHDRLDIAAVNAADLVVVSGDIDAIAALEQTLAAREVQAQRLKITVAAHSAMLDPLLGEFAQRLAEITLHAPAIPCLSNLTGTWCQAHEITDRQYWVKHLRHTVRFSAGFQELLKTPDCLLLEVGPGTTLSALAHHHLNSTHGHTVLTSMRHPRESTSDLAVLYAALGHLWCAGHEVNWHALHGEERRQRLALPTYPFERQRYWIEAGTVAYGPVHTAPAPAARLLHKLSEPGDWCSRPVWRQNVRPQTHTANQKMSPAHWLVFHDTTALSASIVQHLEKMGHRVTSLIAGTHFARLSDTAYVLRPAEPADYTALVTDLGTQHNMPQRIVHLWLAQDNMPVAPPLPSAVASQALGFSSLLYLMQAIGAEELLSPLHLDVVTSGLEQVSDEPVLYPEKALVLGPVKVIPREYAGVSCRAIDLPVQSGLLAGPATTAGDSVATQLLAELLTTPGETQVALRGETRWVQVYEPCSLTESLANTSLLREGGVYLITGGLGGIGMVLAEYLARTRHARLVLVGRRSLPAREHWEQWLTTYGPKEATSRILQQVQALEAMGARVLTAAADVADLAAMHTVMAEAQRLFGAMHGVFHAAGVVDDGLIQLKTPEAAQRVLAPKVQGTLVLEAVLKEQQLDFMVLFSSTSALLGLPGQVDYTAANAFLNAFARSRNTSGSCRTLAINWGVWQEVGMAARAMGPCNPRKAMTQPLQEAPAPAPGVHPLLGRCVQHTQHEVVYAAEYSPRTHWILDQHRLRDGTALVPGTGYIEMARAAMVEAFGEGRLEIRNLVCLAPLVVPDGETRAVRIRLRRDGDAYAFTVSSAPASQNAAPAVWHEHVSGMLAHAQDQLPTRGDLDAIRTRCSQQVSEHPFMKQAQLLSFGPRWQPDIQMTYGAGEALVTLDLPPAFAADQAVYKAHPALLDLAVTCGLPLLPGYAQCTDLYVPFSYGRIDIRGALPTRLYSHVRCRAQSDAQQASALFDITLMNAVGDILMELEEFMVRRVTQDMLLTATPATALMPDLSDVNVVSEKPFLSPLLQAGILPHEGMQALDRILSSPLWPEIVVSPVRLSELIQYVAPPATPQVAVRVPEPAPGSSSSPPPERADAVEQSIVNMWEDLLGVQGIGVDDDFFALGGHSLIAVRLVARLEKMFKVKLRLATLFEARTIHQLANLVRQGRETPQWLSLVPIQPQGSRPPFYCVHGVGGEVLCFSELARLLAPDQPFYAFRSVGHDGMHQPLTQLEAQAALYIKEMRIFQPKGPYYLGGFSHGGRVAFEMAQQLTAMGQQVGFVGVIDTYPCKLEHRNFLHLLYGLRNLPRVFQHGVWRIEVAHQLRFFQRSIKKLKRILHSILAPASAPPVRTDIVQYLNIAHHPESIQRTIIANTQAFHNYRPTMFPGRITLFRVSSQPLFGPHQPDMGWARFAAGGVDVHEVCGAHDTILQQPHVQALARKLDSCLAAAQRGHV